MLALAAGALWASDAVTVPGAKTYAAKCVSCHGKDGKGNPAMAKAFKVEPEKLNLTSDATQSKTDGDLIKITTDGSGKMPAYKGKLSDAEIKDQVAYIRTLAPAKK
jgi:mono/diheme cytochrome c family protein